MVFDLEKKLVVRRCEIVEPPFRKVNPNPRGGLRGLKGICINEKFIVLANASTIFLYDSNWKPIRYFWHPSCANIHDIAIDQDKIWVTSAQNDLLLGFSLKGSVQEIIDLRGFANLINGIKWRPPKMLTLEQFKIGKLNFRDPRTHNWALSDSAHLNSIAILQNGDKLVSCGLLKSQNQLQLMRLKRGLERLGVWEKIYWINATLRKSFMETNNRNQAVIPVFPNPGASAVFRIKENMIVDCCLFIKDILSPSHSINLLSDFSAIYLNTTKGEILNFDPNSGQILSTFEVGKYFLRGAKQLPDGTLLLGDGMRLLHVDLQNKKLISSSTVTGTPNNAIYDIEILPKHFSLPPKSFIEHHTKFLPVRQK